MRQILVVLEEEENGNFSQWKHIIVRPKVEIK